MKRLLTLPIAIAALILVAAVCQAQPKPPQKPAAPAAPAPQAPAIGVVDLDQILNDFEEFNRLNQDFKQFQSQQAVAFDEQYSIRFLDTNEKQEYNQLTADSALPTTKNRARVQELLSTSGAREKELEGLRAKSNPTAEEKTRLDQLSRLEENARKDLAEFRRKLMEARETKQKEFNRLVTDKIDGAIGEAA